jgi:hypothetical protein
MDVLWGGSDDMFGHHHHGDRLHGDDAYGGSSNGGFGSTLIERTEASPYKKRATNNKQSGEAHAGDGRHPLLNNVPVSDPVYINDVLDDVQSMVGLPPSYGKPAPKSKASGLRGIFGLAQDDDDSGGYSDGSGNDYDLNGHDHEYSHGERYVQRNDFEIQPRSLAAMLTNIDREDTVQHTHTKGSKRYLKSQSRRIDSLIDSSLESSPSPMPNNRKHGDRRQHQGERRLDTQAPERSMDASLHPSHPLMLASPSNAAAMGTPATDIVAALVAAHSPSAFDTINQTDHGGNRGTQWGEPTMSPIARLGAMSLSIDDVGRQPSQSGGVPRSDKTRVSVGGTSGDHDSVLYEDESDGGVRASQSLLVPTDIVTSESPTKIAAGIHHSLASIGLDNTDHAKDNNGINGNGDDESDSSSGDESDASQDFVRFEI